MHEAISGFFRYKKLYQVFKLTALIFTICANLMVLTIKQNIY